MSGAADRLAQAIRDVINEAVHAAAVGPERTTPTPARAVERPEIPQEDFDLCPWRNKKHMRPPCRLKKPGISPHHVLRAGQGRRTVAR
jgi:hypothetical protein